MQMFQWDGVKIFFNVYPQIPMLSNTKLLLILKSSSQKQSWKGT